MKEKASFKSNLPKVMKETLEIKVPKIKNKDRKKRQKKSIY